MGSISHHEPYTRSNQPKNDYMTISSRYAIPTLCLTLTLLSGGVAFSAPSAAAPDPSMAQAHLDKGYRLLSRTRYRKAIEELEKAKALYQEPCGRCMQGIALSYYRLDRYEEAVEAYEELFEIESESPSLLQRLVYLYSRLGTPEKSIPAYQAFLESSESSEDMIRVYNAYGVRRLSLDSDLEVHRKEAATAFRNALELAGGRSNLLRRNLAEALWQLGSKTRGFRRPGRSDLGGRRLLGFLDGPGAQLGAGARMACP